MNQNEGGIISQALKDSFGLLESTYGVQNIAVSVSFLEVYNEKIYDLLNESRVVQKSAIKTDVKYSPVDSVDAAIRYVLGVSYRQI